jgi:hypothetical protein
MVPLTALWLPIVLSAVVVFVASSVIHMALKYHSSEYRHLPDEATVLDAMRNGKIAPGFYAFPYAGSMKEMGTPEMMEKYALGPVGTMNVNATGPPAMARPLVRGLSSPWWSELSPVISRAGPSPPAPTTSRSSGWSAAPASWRIPSPIFQTASGR